MPIDTVTSLRPKRPSPPLPPDLIAEFARMSRRKTNRGWFAWRWARRLQRLPFAQRTTGSPGLMLARKEDANDPNHAAPGLVRP